MTAGQPAEDPAPQIDAHPAATVAADGFRVVRSLLDPATVHDAGAALDRRFDADADVAEERGWANEVYRVAYALPVTDLWFLDLATSSAVVDVARAELGDDAVLAACNGLDLPAGSPGQVLHRDHPERTPGATLYLQIVVALDAFDADNGATRLVAGSHRTDALGPTRTVALDPGDALTYDGALLHGAGPNRTERRRRALHLFFARPWVQPHWDFPGSLPEEVASALTVEQRRLLGFDRRLRRYDPAVRRVVR